MAISKLQPSVLWTPTAALSAVQGAFTLSWVIYAVHLPALLAPTRLTAAFAPTLLLIDALLAIVLEPVMGHFADRLEKTNRRFSLIWLGIGLSAALFVLLALLPGTAFVELIPGLLILWAIAMSLFRAPALSLLRQYAPTENLPQAATLITLAAGLAGVARPWATPLIQNLGVSVTFILSTIVLIAAAAALSANHHTNHAPSLPSSSRSSFPDLFPRLGLIAALGVGVTLAFRLAIETFPKVLKAALPQIQPPSIVGWIFIAIAVTAIPAGLLAARIGNRRTMAIGLVAMAVGLAGMSLVGNEPTAIVWAWAFGAAFSLVSNGTLPFALALIPPGAAGLSVGAFFGGVSIATSLFLAFSSSFTALPVAITVGLMAIVLAAVCLVFSQRSGRAEVV
ncbi:MFS transporter [Leptolyngbya ohadii]|uniref:MFS transporter n=1 Tax=Leptolyngbya ohadii TaxID=1962290 RepID=UPI000B5A039D|nr:MFS transporter [Leptolyngbya ohadii]